LIIVADAHVSMTNGNHASFFDMLSSLEETSSDIVFLGDIFDLWISLPRYEEEIQKRFLAWCSANRKQRRIGFIEGNHEFFVVERNRDCFSWSDGACWAEEGFLFVHGDLINRADKNYLRFRRLSKNLFTKTLVRFLPFGPSLVYKMKRGLKKTNQAFRLGLPRQALEQFAEQSFSQGHRTIVVGHFHEHFHFEQSGASLQVLPAWYSDGEIARLDRTSGQITTGPWETMLSH